MTKTLTEQWKDGELENGMFYLVVKDEEGVYVTIDTHSRMFNVWGIVRDKDIKEVLAPVPSYEEWQAELDSNDELLTVQKRLEKKLAIATKALNIYSAPTGIGSSAYIALREIEEVK